MIRIGFFTGSRAEYGLSKNLLIDINQSDSFELIVYPLGLHFKKKFGNTIHEIESDDFLIGEKIDSYKGLNNEKVFELTKSVEMVYNSLKNDILDAVLVVGDRLEPYAVALAAHFLNIKIIHIGGGTITSGAVDNIYRYNISNLSHIHFATSRNNYNRLNSIPIIDKNKIFFFGATAIKQVKQFLKSPSPIVQYVQNLNNKFVLLTFHPVTLRNEPIDEIMELCINMLIHNNFYLLITYPNNDDGYEKIINVINRWEEHQNIFIVKNLGIPAYYSAIYNCEFVIGNSSSGIIEVPYFGKNVINVGSRQDGRDKDAAIYDVKAEIYSVKTILDRFLNNEIESASCNELYGDGNVNENILNVLKNELNIE